jgi:hypothetical protein
MSGLSRRLTMTTPYSSSFPGRAGSYTCRETDCQATASVAYTFTMPSPVAAESILSMARVYCDDGHNYDVELDTVLLL